jgi:serine/threonine protein kinase
MNKESETQVPIESVFNNLNISNNSKIINHKNCYNEKFKRPWCKECVPSCIIEGWTSENHDIDEFIKDTIYDSRLRYIDTNYYPLFLEWVSYDKFEDIKQIGVGGFAKVYSAIWIDGQVKYKRQDDGSWKKVNSEPIKVALKLLNGSQNMSDEYLNEVIYIYDFFFSLNKYDLLIIKYCK